MSLKGIHRGRSFVLVVLLSTSVVMPRLHSQNANPGAPASASTASGAKSASNKFEEWQRWWRTEFIKLDHYREENAKLKGPGPGENRVVFFGDSITEGWRLDESFPGAPYVNRGISGEMTLQMLVRFRSDVIDLQPKAVVILGGINDISPPRGPLPLDDIERYYASMSELAHVHGIRVVFSSVMPISNYAEEPAAFYVQSPPKILELNRWLKDYSSRSGDVYLDYFSAMVDEHGLLKRELSDDGLHPNREGYKVMTPLAETAIKKAVSS